MASLLRQRRNLVIVKSNYHSLFPKRRNGLITCLIMIYDKREIAELKKKCFVSSKWNKLETFIFKELKQGIFISLKNCILEKPVTPIIVNNGLKIEIVTWKSKNQVAEAKFRRIAKGITVLWLQKLLKELGFHKKSFNKLYCDYNAVISISVWFNMIEQNTWKLIDILLKTIWNQKLSASHLSDRRIN